MAKVTHNLARAGQSLHSPSRGLQTTRDSWAVTVQHKQHFQRTKNVVSNENYAIDKSYINVTD